MEKKIAELVEQYFLIFLSLVALILSFYFIGVNFLIFIAFIPLFYYMNEKKIKGPQLFVYFLFFYGSTLFFINKISVEVKASYLTYIALILFLSTGAYLFFSVFKRGIFRFLQIDDLPLIFILSQLLFEMILENKTLGFPWITAFLPTAVYPAFASVASLFGAYFISLEVYLINYFIYKIIKNAIVMYLQRKVSIPTVVSRKKQILTYLIIIALIFAFNFLWYAFNPYDSKIEKTNISIAVGQPNIPLNFKYRYEFFDLAVSRIQKMTAFARMADCDLVIWPESAIPTYLETKPEILSMLSKLSKSNKIGIIVGTPDMEINNNKVSSFNSAYYFDKQGIYHIYHKIQLVPFGEFIPFADTLKFLRKIAPEAGIDQTFGTLGNPFVLNDKEDSTYYFYPTICFESIFTNIFVKMANNNPSFFVNIVNDSWYDSTFEHEQHLYHNVFRAIETKKMIFRSATTGISAIIDQKGQIIRKLDQGEENIITSKLSIYNGKTFYVKYGWIWIKAYRYFGCLVLLIAILSLLFPKFSTKKFIHKIFKISK